MSQSRPMVLLFTSHGCPACAAAIPEWERFKTRNPMTLALVLDADGPFVEHFGLKPIKVTPLYVMKAGESGVMHEGMLRAEALEKWVKTSAETLDA